MSNPRHEMSHFVIGVADLLREECHMAMLHDDMILDSLMVYAQSIEDSKLKRMCRNLKRSGSSDKEQSKFMKRAQTHAEPS